MLLHPPPPPSDAWSVHASLRELLENHDGVFQQWSYRHCTCCHGGSGGWSIQEGKLADWGIFHEGEGA